MAVTIVMFGVAVVTILYGIVSTVIIEKNRKTKYMH